MKSIDNQGKDMASNAQMIQHHLKVHGMTLILGLIVEYLLGMFSNLYVQFPETNNAGQLWQFAWTQVSVASHILLGLLLLLGILFLLVRAWLYKDRNWMVAAVIGLVGILAAGYCGASFIQTQNDSFSLLMSIAFIVALLALVWGFHASKEQS